MAQLVEWSIPVPEVRGSNPVIGKIYIEQLFTINCIEKTKINKKKPGMAHFFKKKPYFNFYTNVLTALNLSCKLLFFAQNAVFVVKY